MNGKERVLKALRFEEVDRVPWVPFTGVHVAKLVGSDAEEMLKNGDILVNAVETAAKRYYADGVCSAFDLQAEAEVLGCGLHWSKNNPPRARRSKIFPSSRRTRDASRCSSTRRRSSSRE